MHMDNQQLESLYRANFQKVYNYAYYRLLNAADAEDVTSEVFTKVVANFESFDPSKASFSTWVLRITHNAVVDRFRKNKPSVPIDEVKYDEPSCEDEYPGLDDRQEKVAGLLALLSGEDREMVFLKYYEEKKNVEIAEILDMNPSTVATRLRRALLTMRKKAEME